MTKLTEFQKKTTIPDALFAYMAEKNLNKAEISRLSGVGTTQLNFICKRETSIPNDSKKGFSEIGDMYYEKICRAIGFALKIEVWRHFNTQNFKQIIPKIEESRREKESFTIDGDTGTGKSHALNIYKIKKPNETYLVTCSAVENAKEFAKNIAEVVKVETTGTVGAITKRIIKKLESESDSILLIDEAEHIGSKPGYINILKTLEDGLRKKVSIGIIGMGINKILENGYEKNKQNFRQTARRFCNRETLESNIREDIMKTCEEIGISEESVKNWFANRVRNFGELEVYIRKTFKEAEKSGEKITTKFLSTIEF